MKTIIERASDWIVSGDTGASSQAIWARMMGAKGERSYPHDQSDFGRCYRLLSIIPEWRERILEMASVSAYWEALAPRWSEVEAVYLAEIAAGEQKRGTPSPTYELLKSITRPIEAKDDSVIRFNDGMSIRFGPDR